MKTVFKIVTILIVLLSILTVFYFIIQEKYELEEIQPFVAIAWAVAGTIWATTGIILNWTSLREQSRKNQKTVSLIQKKPVKYFNYVSSFVNRKNEFEQILASIKNRNLVNVHGHKGSGKSEILKIIHDALNGFHKKELLLKISKPGIYLVKLRTFYFDLNEVAGVINVLRQVSNKIFGVEVSGINELANLVEKQFKKKPVAFILDNINSLQAGSQILEYIFEYQRIRPNDKFILGSVYKVFDFSRSTFYIEIEPLEDEGIVEYLNQKYDKDLSIDLEKIKARTRGLPIFLNLLIVELEEGRNLSLDISIENYLSRNILQSLSRETRRLLEFLSYFNLTSTVINVDALINFPLNDIDLHLETLRRYSTIIDIRNGSNGSIKIHDLIRDLVIKQAKANQLAINGYLAEYYLRIQDKHRAVLHWLLSDRKLIPYSEVLELLNSTIKSENYPYLAAVWDISTRNKEQVYESREDLFLQRQILYGYVRALLGTGDYKGAETLMKSSQFGELSLPDLRLISNEDELNFHLSLADLDHLLNRYNQSFEIVEVLLTISIQRGYTKKRIECLWLMAHLKGHSGTDMLGAIDLYNECLAVEDKFKAPLIFLKCENGILALEAAMNKFSEHYLDRINTAIEKASNLNGGEATWSSLLRNKARFFRRNKDYSTARDIINESLELARKKRLRTIFNCYLSYGDIDRFSGNYNEAVDYYKMVLEFTKENGDDHLMSSALGGIFISEICQNQLIYHDSWDLARKNLTRWIKKTYDLGLLVSSLRLEIISGYMPDFESVYSTSHMTSIASAYNLNYEKHILMNSSLELLKTMEMHIH